MISHIAPYCISVFVIYKNKTGSKYLLLRRSGQFLFGTWQMVTGGIHAGELAWQAALREIVEETGLIPEKLYSADAVETFYSLTNDKINFVPVFVAFVDAMDSVILSPTEHDAYEWLSLDEACERLIWTEQKRIMKLVHERFVVHEPHAILRININDAKMIPKKNKKMVTRMGVYGVARQNGEILLIKQPKGPYEGKFDLPGGGIEFGESSEQTLEREFQEEVNMAFDTMNIAKNITAVIDVPNIKGKDPYIFYQIGLIYDVTGLRRINENEGELQSHWLDPKNLTKENCSALLWKFLEISNSLKPILQKDMQ